MKRLLILIFTVLFSLLFIAFSGLYLWIRNDVKANIQIAQSKYGGDPEGALMDYLQDKSNSYHDRTHTAVWTLGQIRSAKAHDLLRGYYKNDPEGNTCYGNHDQMLCQYELYKAIQSIEKRKLFSYASLK